MKTNDEHLLSQCRHALKAYKNLRYSMVYEELNPGKVYTGAIDDMFEKSSYVFCFRKGPFYGVLGAVRMGVAEYSLWLATTGNIEDHARTLLRSLRPAAEWFNSVNGGFAWIYAEIPQAFETWAKHLGGFGWEMLPGREGYITMRAYLGSL